MAKNTYNSVGAGETPKLGGCSFIEGEAHDGGSQTFAAVTVSTDIPKVAPRSGYGKDMGSVPGEPMKASRPGGNQGITGTFVKGKSGIERMSS